MIALLLTRWRFGLSLAAGLAVLGIVAALSHYRHAYASEKALRAADRASYEAAQVEAQAKAFAIRQAEKAALDAKAQKGQANYEALKSRYADATARWVRSQAAQGGADRAGAERQADDPGLPAISAASPIMVAEADLTACSAAVAYGDAAHKWALSLDEAE